MAERTYVVSGSASGIGAATAARLRGHGHRVVGVDMHDADVVADLSTVDGRALLVDGVHAATGGRIDGVVACAGISSGDPITVRVNFFGVVATLEGLRPLLAESEHPRAATISSIALHQTLDNDVVEACLAGDEERAVAAAHDKGVLLYPSTKRALACWVRREAVTDAWAGAGITLNAVAPGVVLTPMTDPLLGDPVWRDIVDEAVPMPLGGYAEPDEIAALLEWLTSEDNSKVTGQVIFEDGGADATLRPADVWVTAAPPEIGGHVKNPRRSRHRS
jgi:NAD(P)-dependent dehydrogenase (short-subunit alcohol dehydrogenase family)